MPRAVLCLFAAACFALAGCGGGGGGAPSVEVSLESDLTDLGQMYDLHVKQVKRPPGKYEDLSAVTANAPATAAPDGRLKVYWGASVSPAGTAVLAHDAAAESKGGWVLLTDCKTVKQMTAEEFKAAPKAGKK